MEKRGNVTVALNKLKEKERTKSKQLDKIILLNRAWEKIDEFKQKNIKEFDLVQVLEDEEADISSKIGKHKPLYRTLFPEWGRLHAKFLNVKTEGEKGQKYIKKVETAKQTKSSYPMCLPYFK